MIQKIELLVHAGAPSGRKDDDKYKAQAQAYLAFNGKTVNVSSSNRRLQDDIDLEKRLASEGHDDTTVLEDHPTLFLDDTQLAYTALDSQLITSSLKGLDESSSGHPPANAPNASIPEHQFSRSQSELRESDENGSHHERTNSGYASRKRSLENGIPPTAGIDNGLGTAQPEAMINRPPETPILRGFSQSSYLKTPILDRSAKKRRLNASAEPVSKAPKPLRASGYIPVHENGRVGVAYIGDQPVQSTEHAVPAEGLPSQNSNGDDEVTSELPTSYSLSDITSESSRAKTKERPDISQRSSSDPGPVGIKSPSALSEALTSKAQVDQTLSQHSTVVTTPRATVKAPTVDPAGIGKHPSKPGSGRQAQAQAVADESTNAEGTVPAPDTHFLASNTIGNAAALTPLRALSTTIRPPEPTVALDKFSSHVTETLRYLAETSDVANSYKPVSVTRELRPLERGHWLVDCSSWLDQAQIDFWQFLEKTVGNGNAGWGVWCTREASDEGPATSKATGFGTVKVLCWGEVVKHVYLMLYVASKSKVRKLGLQWIDAEGEVVVQMRKS